MEAHILVVDDDAAIRDVIREYLTENDFQVSVAETGADMDKVLGAEVVDLVILDLKLPDEDGLAIARRLRESLDLPIIILTGRKEEVDRVMGLELGADDYVTKPFDLRELLARVRSVLRRSVPAMATAETAEATFQFAGYCLHPLERTLRNGRGDAIALTTGEYELLRVFVEHPNRVLSRDDLMERIHGRNAGPFDRAIDVQIARLRRKIEPDATAPELIKSVRGAGYLFAARVQRGR